ncbi:MAG: aldo/keto reductase [Anaerolineae bacterium]|nr:aldo/keto reductase [Anaerolineae bacterium]
MAIPGKATAENTHQYTIHFPHLTYNPVGLLGWQVSQAGFGGYRIDKNNSTHEQALRFALQKGINLVDTSSNYTDGNSERLIGRVLVELSDRGELSRDETVIVSKAGYLQGFNYALAQQRKQEGRPFPNLIKYAEGLDHCIHPEFLADQLTRSLERLNLETLDVYLLHNPEYYLMWAKRAHLTREQAQEEYYRRIQQAFVHLEEEVADGRIQCYGVSSHTFPEPAGHFTFTSLAHLWQIATNITPDHHFRVIQAPMNLFETGLATEQNQTQRQTVLQFAQQYHLAVLINRPLNAFHHNSLTRLAHVAMPNYPAPPEDVSTGVDTLLNLEAQLRTKIVPTLPVSNEQTTFLHEQLTLGSMLEGHWGGFGTYQNWLDLRSQFLLPRIQTAVETLSNLENLPVYTLEWLDEYVEAANITLTAITAYYQELAARHIAPIWQAAQTADVDWNAQTLSQTAVRALRSTEGVTSILVGMRRQEYVQDILADLQRPVSVENRMESWQTMQSWADI